jgi:hypothetical protein
MSASARADGDYPECVIKSVCHICGSGAGGLAHLFFVTTRGGSDQQPFQSKEVLEEVSFSERTRRERV